MEQVNFKNFTLERCVIDSFNAASFGSLYLISLNFQTIFLKMEDPCCIVL